jgi:hypothetical protein
VSGCKWAPAENSHGSLLGFCLPGLPRGGALKEFDHLRYLTRGLRKDLNKGLEAGRTHPNGRRLHQTSSAARTSASRRKSVRERPCQTSMFMICSSLSWTNLQVVVVPDYSSRPFPMQARQSEFTSWLAHSSARIISTASSLRPNGCTFRCSRSAGYLRAIFAPRGRRPWRCEPGRSRFRSIARQAFGGGRAIARSS